MENELTFNGQRKNEKVVEAKRNHALVLLPTLLWAMVFALIAVALIIFWGGSIAEFLAAFSCLIGILIAARVLYSYLNTVFLITNERIINVVQKGFFNSSIVESDICCVHNMISNKSGVLRSMFDFGNLTIRISDDIKDREMIVKNIPSPYETESLIASAKNDSQMKSTGSNQF